MPDQVVGNKVIRNDGSVGHGRDHQHARALQRGDAAAEMPEGWEIGETALRVPRPDGRGSEYGLLTQEPQDADDRVGVMVAPVDPGGAPSFRWIRIADCAEVDQIYLLAYAQGGMDAVGKLGIVRLLADACSRLEAKGVDDPLGELNRLGEKAEKMMADFDAEAES